jgi:hypothetical protein
VCLLIFEILEQISESEIIAVNKSIRELKRLKKAYGGGRWRKMKGVFIIRFQSGDVCRAEIHWYEAHGKGKKDLKIKRFWNR